MIHVCPECFSRPIFQRRVREARAKTVANVKCPRHPTRKGVPIDLIGPLVDTVFRSNYRLGEFMFEEQEGQEIAEIIGDITGADDWDVACALAGWLVDNDHYWPADGSGPFYGIDQCYVPASPDGWRQGALWSHFRSDVLHRQRFFNEKARDLLGQIFEGVQFQADAGGNPAFYELGPDNHTELFRARIVGNEEMLRRVARDPAEEMGPPPPQLRRSGRMNAAGVPVFYGAFDMETAVAELRPPVGAELCVAAFRLVRPIRVLDLTRFAGPGKQIDVFSLNHAKRTSQWQFMLSFAREISKPVLPGDEHLEYVPAQIVAEYLSSTPRSWKGREVTVDAIVFGSAQRLGGCNIAVLGEASGVSIPRAQDAPSQSHDLDLEALGYAASPSSAAPSLAYIDESFQHIRVEGAEFKHEKLGSLSGSMSDDGPEF